MESDEKFVIPTRTKGKISHELSFPLGAERLSKALADTPQISDLVLHFKSDRWNHTRFHRYPCIGAAHRSRYAERPYEHLDSAGISLFSEWQIMVFPVPRVHRHRIQQRIFNQALPEINRWLHQCAKNQLLGEEALTFYFDDEKDELTPEIETRLHPQRI